MKAAEWIDRIKDEKGWESDYRVAQALDVSRATISLYRSKQSTFDDETAIKVADALGAEPALLLIDQAAERTRSERAKESMTRFLREHGFNWPLHFNTGRPMTRAEIEFREKHPNERWTAGMRLANQELGFEAPLDDVLRESKRYRNGRLMNKASHAIAAIATALTLGLFAHPEPALAGIGGNGR